MHLRMPSIDRGVQSFIWAVVFFLFLYFAFVQTTPIVSIWEVREGHHIQVKAQRQALAASRQEP